VICPVTGASGSASVTSTSSYQHIALTTSYVASSYIAPPYSASGNATAGGSKPTGTKGVTPTFTGAGNMMGGSLGLVAAVAFVVAAL
jgi:hypothetical protein